MLADLDQRLIFPPETTNLRFVLPSYLTYFLKIIKYFPDISMVLSNLWGH